MLLKKKIPINDPVKFAATSKISASRETVNKSCNISIIMPYSTTERSRISIHLIFSAGPILKYKKNSHRFIRTKWIRLWIILSIPEKAIVGKS